MFTVLSCVFTQHDHATVVVAALVALLGMAAFFNIEVRALESAAMRRAVWQAAAAVIGGFGVWATHFIAMLAYRGALPIGFDLPFTALSAVVAALGFRLAIFAGGSARYPAMAKAAIVTLTVAAMHFLGMKGITVAADVNYRMEPVAIGALAAFWFFHLAFFGFARTEGWMRIAASALPAVGGICILHFTAMSATVLTDNPLLPAPSSDEIERVWLTSAVTGVALLIVVISAVATMIDRLFVDLDGFANATLDGLIVVRNGRIIEANKRFSSLMEGARMPLIGQDPNGLLRTFDGLPVDAARDSAVEAAPLIGNPDRLFELAAHRIQYRGKPCQVVAIRDLTERRAVQRKVEYLARHDALTGLANRAAFQDALDGLRQNDKPFALLALDLDRFKAVNDLFGHAAGDSVLKSVARIFLSVCGAGAVVARLGGDEFAILLPGCTDAQTASATSAGILARFGEEMNCNTDPMAVGVSIGIALYPADGVDAAGLMHSADLALYRAKTSGRGTAAFYDTLLDQEIKDRRQLEADLKQAIIRNELFLLYQPIRAVEDGEICGMEALVRWNHPTRGPVPPGVFIPVAEETGIIIALGEWILRQACMTAATWPSSLKIAVNISPVQFRLASLPYFICSILEETGLSPTRLELEVTESALLKDRDAVLATLNLLKAMGVKIVMDDFGTGYSSLSNLQTFPFDKIKIDRSFTATMNDDENSRQIVRAVIGLGKSLCLPVTAEGIETEEQYEMMVKEGCSQVQGYLLGIPTEAPQLPGRDAAARA